ncbi:MAG: pyridoxal-dependent decarboxylase [Terracidiphilus sp.]
MITEIRRHFDGLQDEILNGPIAPGVIPEQIRNHLASRFDFARAMDLDEVVAEVEHMLAKWQVQVTHPRYFGLFNPSVTFPSVIADTLVAMFNPQLASWRTSPAANEIEKFTLDWIARKFGLPKGAVANFTSGGAEANHSAVIVALTRAFPEYGDKGLRSLTAAPTIYLTNEAHHSFTKIAHMTGLGRQSLRTVATDGRLKMDLADLERNVADDRAKGFAPFMVVGTCGTTAAGAIDPLPELGSFCRSRGLWFHVDAAWGGAAIMAPGLGRYLEGVESADSITCDAHKWFSVPMGCGMFFCGHPESVLQAFRTEAAYMPSKTSGAVLDPYTSSMQWSRRFIGLKLFLSLAVQGEAGQAEAIEHQTRMGRVLRDTLVDSGWQIVNDTPLPLVCFTREGLDVQRFLTLLHARQIAWMSEAQVNGLAAVRACITSFKTTESDIHWVVREMNRLVMEEFSAQLVRAEC